ncbi:helix-turn-helix transcriptional regulator [Blastococcus sp. VKM Ac-2987]|uniref:helix-turn-helix transcriptional regulator n=1 Tax=Blastococcus sp. VKM Ac-2987 TaxID=3004141 RepID=UPI0022AB8B46|nr:WYL domain-containing protein [Blastococcus sp. VKM Ac-2987]MCZ2857364.1 WYL domain-containing protein [Blastococcus sp. VKM Ac-2987]
MKRTGSRSPATLPPVTLTPEEAAAVAVALASSPEGPYAEAGRGALEKVLAVLEPDARRRAQLLATSLWVSAEAGRSAQVRGLLERAVTGRQVLALRYRDGRGRSSHREVEPQLLARSGEHWFLVAWCRERQAARWFREDRIESAEPTGEVAAARELTGVGAPPPTEASSGARSRHPAGRARRTPEQEPGRPRLVVLPGGRGRAPAGLRSTP